MTFRSVGTSTCNSDSATVIGDADGSYRFKFEMSYSGLGFEYLYSKAHFEYLNVERFCLLAESQQLATFTIENAFTDRTIKVPLERWVVMQNEHNNYAGIYLTTIADNQVHFVFVILDDLRG